MSTIDKIKNKLRKYPQLNCQIEDNRISVEPSSITGFTVWLIDNNPGYTVGFDGWHEEFDNEDEDTISGRVRACYTTIELIIGVKHPTWIRGAEYITAIAMIPLSIFSSVFIGRKIKQRKIN